MKWYWIAVLLVLIVGLSFFGGYSVKKCECPEVRDSVEITEKPLPPKDASLHITKPAKPKKPIDLVKDSTVNIDSCPQKQTFTQIIDTTIVFNSDSLDFVAEIDFDGEKFNNFFDFSLRKFGEKIIHYVKAPARLEVYQEPLVIALIALTSFLFGLVL